MKKISRREFLTVVAAASAAGLLSACGGSSGGSLFGSGDRVGLGSGSDRIGLSLVRSRGTARSERYGGSNYCEHHDRFCQSFHNNKN